MKIVNIGIVAHVDAGKTSLTERILFETNVIDAIGRVDQGNTQTDSLDLEKRRGITIKASVVSFFVQDLKINLIDTPGHADFIAEVERSFSVLDGAILVISAVEGIQAQTKFLMALLMKLGIPTIIFVNKIDRRGAQSHTLVKQIKEKLTECVIPLYTPENIGTKQAFIVGNSFSIGRDQAFLEECIGLVALNDEQLLEAYVNEEKVIEEQVKSSLTSQIRDAKLYPIFFGSAMTGIGVAEPLTGVAVFFPNDYTKFQAKRGDCLSCEQNRRKISGRNTLHLISLRESQRFHHERQEAGCRESSSGWMKNMEEAQCAIIRLRSCPATGLGQRSSRKASGRSRCLPSCTAAFTWRRSTSTGARSAICARVR
jgi:small GTP-binding protein